MAEEIAYYYKLLIGMFILLAQTSVSAQMPIPIQNCDAEVFLKPSLELATVKRTRLEKHEEVKIYRKPDCFDIGSTQEKTAGCRHLL
jgi:hypothetical protein